MREIGTASLLADLGHEVPHDPAPSPVTSALGTPAAALGVIEGVSDVTPAIATTSAFAALGALIATQLPRHTGAAGESRPIAVAGALADSR